MKYVWVNVIALTKKEIYYKNVPQGVTRVMVSRSEIADQVLLNQAIILIKSSGVL